MIFAFSYAVIPKDSRLLVVEIVIPPQASAATQAVMYDLHMMAMTNGIERTECEFIMTREKALYKSYLIRICNNELSQVHRVVLTRINEEGEQEHFTSIDDLMIFLLHEMDEPKEEND